MFPSRRAANLFLFAVAFLFIPNTFAAGTETNPSRVPNTSLAGKSATRLSRPASTQGNDKPCCAESATKKAGTGAAKQQINGFLAGVSNRWWRNFRNPTFCPFIICGGSCANMMGVPIVGAYTASELLSDETPCSIESVESSGGCCMSHGSTDKDIKAQSGKDLAANSACGISEGNAKAAADCCSAK